MIGKLTGTFAGASVEGQALVDVGGVGYSVRVPLSLIESANAGQNVSLYVHTAVRDDAIDLYGFLREEELSFFKLLMSVSGLGPKTALAILNTSDTAGLRRAIGAGDTASLHKVYGLGKKTAERVVVELRDKFVAHGKGGPSGTDAEVIEALTALGYRLEESREALRALGVDGAGDVRARLSAALRRLGSRAAA